LVSPQVISSRTPDRHGYYNRRSDGNATLQYAQKGSPELHWNPTELKRTEELRLPAVNMLFANEDSGDESPALHTQAAID
jgi:hypothetical protein